MVLFKYNTFVVRSFRAFFWQLSTAIIFLECTLAENSFLILDHGGTNYREAGEHMSQDDWTMQARKLVFFIQIEAKLDIF